MQLKTAPFTGVAVAMASEGAEPPAPHSSGTPTRHASAGGWYRWSAKLDRGSCTRLAVTLLPLQILYFEDMRLGMTETYSKIVKSSDVVGFAEISGDRNPVHLSEHFAAKTSFKGRIAHGLYTASLISAVIGTRLPGPGAIYVSQTLHFRAPVKIGDTVVASVEVTELIEKGRRAKLLCQCSVRDTLVLEGEAIVKVPSRPEPRHVAEPPSQQTG
jgi:3-hydroxybutyryl-CoA dehydratase